MSGRGGGGALEIEPANARLAAALLDLDFDSVLTGPRHGTIAAGLEQALEIGSRNATARASAEGGFLDDPRIIHRFTVTVAP